MSFRPTRSGTACARIAVSSFDVSWFGEVCESTTFRFGCVALNFLTSATARPLVAALVQNWTVTVAPTPNPAGAARVRDDAAAVTQSDASAATSAVAARPRIPVCLICSYLPGCGG